MSLIRCILIGIFALGAPLSVYAAPPTLDAQLESESRHPKARQLAISGFGGSYLGASVGSTFLTGGRATYFLTREIGLGAGYGYSRLASGHDLAGAETKDLHIVNGLLEMSIDAAVRISAKTVLEFDLFGLFGGGAMRLAGDWKGMGLIGGGLRVYTAVPWLAVYIEVMNFLHSTQRVDGKRFETDISFTLGPAFLLPPRSRSR